MLGWKIFVKSVMLLFNNIGPALRISVVPFVYLIALMFALFGSVFLTSQTVGPGPFGPGFALGFIVVFFVSLFVMIWVAVGWHRYVLLSEQPAALWPRLHWSRIFGYLGTAILLGLLVIAAFIPVGMIAFGLFSMDSGPGMVLGGAAYIVGYFVIVVGLYRVSIVLPAAAIGKPRTFSDAWHATRGQTGTLLMLLLVTVVAIVLFSLVGFVLGMISPILSVVFQILLQWVSTMVGIALLTTLYGYFIEERPLD